MLRMAVGLMVGSMAFSISGGNPCWQQCAAFVAGSCIYSRHCAVNGIKVGKIIRSLRLPQFAVRQPANGRLRPMISEITWPENSAGTKTERDNYRSPRQPISNRHKPVWPVRQIFSKDIRRPKRYVRRLPGAIDKKTGSGNIAHGKEPDIRPYPIRAVARPGP